MTVKFNVVIFLDIPLQRFNEQLRHSTTFQVDELQRYGIENRSIVHKCTKAIIWGGGGSIFPKTHNESSALFYNVENWSYFSIFKLSWKEVEGGQLPSLPRYSTPMSFYNLQH